MEARVKLMVWQVSRRRMSVLDVPEELREAVLDALPETDRRRALRELEGGDAE